MIVRDSGALPAALDRLLQVDRVASLEPLPPFTDRSDAAPIARAGSPPTASSGPASTAPAPPGAAAATTETLIAALPLGGSITARVVDVPAVNHVVADIGDLRIALAWPAASGIAPQPGQDVVLRVLAHRPMLLFQSVEGERPDASNDDVRWSSDAMRLQAIGSSTTAQPGAGPLRFDIPILRIEVEPLPSQDGEDADDRDPSSAVARNGTGRAASAASSTIVERPSSQRSSPPLLEHASDIALDDIIVGHGTALVNGVEAPLIPHLQDSGLPPTPPFSPLVLQGPAWDGQPIELVVRRERDDELFDNPVLDHWCGEVTIDLPQLGRVAGHLSFSMQGLRVRIEGDDEHGVMTMSAASGELAAALAHADLRVAGLTVAGRSADTTRTDWSRGLDQGLEERHG